MAAAHTLEYAALAVAVIGLAAVAIEILVKDPVFRSRWNGGKTAPTRTATRLDGRHGHLGHAA